MLLELSTIRIIYPYAYAAFTLALHFTVMYLILPYFTAPHYLYFLCYLTS
jgi:hypothetical protein